MQQEALDRATNGQTLSNFPAIFLGFIAKGIPESEIKPHENVLTYHAWRAIGRQVRRGEHGVRVCTFVTCEGKRDESEPVREEADPNKAKRGFRRPWTATVFHISQTDPLKA
jgi:antirestriction protein ArdC